MTRDNQMREALSELMREREKNQEEVVRRTQAVRRDNPRIAELMDQRVKLLGNGIGRMLSGEKNVSVRGEMNRLNLAVRQELVRMGLPDDYLQPIVTCPLCQDTGYVGENIREMCTCLKTRMTRVACSSGGVQFSRQNFSTFDERVFPDELLDAESTETQRSYMLKVRRLCERYADSFTPGEGQGLVFYGMSGLGKTFLMNCIGARVLERGFSVMTVTASRLVEIVKAQQMAGEEEEQMQEMLHCDLLLLDDLGSEVNLRNWTPGAMFHVINDRMVNNRAMIISTNDTPERLEDRYGQRVVFRLTDPLVMRSIAFRGKNVRQTAAKVQQRDAARPDK